jgi:hypothetical protein
MMDALWSGLATLGILLVCAATGRRITIWRARRAARYLFDNYGPDLGQEGARHDAARRS